VNNDTSSFILTKKPTYALLKSAILPGWGQYYNESYWKIPIALGAVGWFIYNYFDYNKEYYRYKNLYLENINTSLSDRYKQYREFYKDQRDIYAIYLVLAYLANLIDAYVDAHLFDFTVKEDFSKKYFILETKFKF
jgi:hypothetical protein